MEVKINKDVREYTESMFFGLSLRQFVFSFIALIVAVVIYFWLKPHFGTETVSWMCVLGAAPFAALGFINYHGLNAEQLLWAWLKSEIIEPKKLIFESTTLYYDVLKENITKREKEAMKSNDKNSPDND
ncbi:MAG: PrgI family protein [Oscillospiraceae bacterium]|nr:PrgI family protein [Oscillospiraceae bacterium]